LPAERVRITLTNRLTQAIKAIDDVDQQISAAELILSTATTVQDAELRIKTTNIWVKACAKKYKQDDNTVGYVQTMQPVLERIALMNPALRYEMLRRLGDEVISQHSLSYEMEKIVYGQVEHEDFTSKDMAFGVSQTLVDMLSKGSEQRIAA